MRPFILLLVTATSLSAQARGARVDTVAARRAIIDLEQRIGPANFDCDYKFFAQVEATEFIFTDARGGVTTRSEDLAGESSCKRQRRTYVLEDIRLQFHGDVAVFNAKATTTITRDTLPASVSRNRFTDVLVQRNGHWVLVAGHSSRIP